MSGMLGRNIIGIALCYKNPFGLTSKGEQSNGNTAILMAVSWSKG